MRRLNNQKLLAQFFIPSELISKSLFQMPGSLVSSGTPSDGTTKPEYIIAFERPGSEPRNSDSVDNPGIAPTRANAGNIPRPRALKPARC
jgi:hypothetical protein